jgi:hypothetical protein
MAGLRGIDYPAQTAWYTTQAMVTKSGYSKVTLNKGLQIRPNDDYGMRGKVGFYRVKQDTIVPTGKALNNTDWGPGGYDQFFIENWSDILEFLYEVALN